MRKVVFITFFYTWTFSSALAQKNGHGNYMAATPLTQWMDLHCQLVKNCTGIAHVAYSRHFSYTAIAAYESIYGTDPAYRSLSGQLSGLVTIPSSPGKELYPAAALNAAYASMMRYFYKEFGNSASRIDSLEHQQQQFFLKQGISGRKLEQSRWYGKKVAQFIMKWAETDHNDNKRVYEALKNDSSWAPTPPHFTAAAPFWSENRSLTSGLEQIKLPNAPAYSTDTNSFIYRMAKEVYITSKQLTDYEKATALYWDDSPDGKYMTVFGHWTSILSGLIKTKQLTLIKGAEAFVKMTAAMYETAIITWKGKYQYHMMRPVGYIKKFIDAAWSPLIATPPHPEFPAAHASLSAAAATALCSSFGDSCAVTDESYTNIGMAKRSYASLQEMAKEAGTSRVYGGIHYRFSVEQSLTLGKVVAEHVLKHIRFRSLKPAMTAISER